MDHDADDRPGGPYEHQGLEVLGEGRTARVYALDDHRAARVFRLDVDVAGEAAVMRHVAQHGYPVPQVERVDGTTIIMDRVHGPTMLSELEAGDLDPRAAGKIIGSLLDRLHAIPALGGAAPGRSVLHLDLHPGNVMLGPDGPVVVDWTNATDGPPALDVAMAAVILAQAALTLVGPELQDSIRTMITEILATAGTDPLPALDDALALRSRDPMLGADEIAALDDAAALVRACWATAGGRRRDQGMIT